MSERDGEQFCDVGGGVRLCFRVDGPDDGEPLLLIAGLGLELTSWHPTLIDALVDGGRRVIRFDNRDSGRSSRIPTRPPNQVRQLLSIPRAHDYTIEDMADDTVGLLDAVGVDAADVVGMSMGGMIAQALAAAHPERVRTLTSIFSTPGGRRVGQPAFSTLLRMLGPSAATEDAFVAAHRRMTAHIGVLDSAAQRAHEDEWARTAWRRSHRDGIDDHGAGEARQIGAIRKSGDRTAALATITAPTLVVHGDRDRMVNPSGGWATAKAIPGARHVTVPGMRHHLPASLTPRLVRLIDEHTRAARAAEPHR